MNKYGANGGRDNETVRVTPDAAAAEEPSSMPAAAAALHLLLPSPTASQLSDMPGITLIE